MQKNRIVYQRVLEVCMNAKRWLKSSKNLGAKAYKAKDANADARFVVGLVIEFITAFAIGYATIYFLSPVVDSLLHLRDKPMTMTTHILLSLLVAIGQVHTAINRQRNQ